MTRSREERAPAALWLLPGPYVAETFLVTIEQDYLVMEL
jgi:hypothetical protein